MMARSYGSVSGKTNKNFLSGIEGVEEPLKKIRKNILHRKNRLLYLHHQNEQGSSFS
jgi:hypothetical protein